MATPGPPNAAPAAGAAAASEAAAPRAPTKRRRLSGLHLVGAGLLLALIAAVLVQARQFVLLDEALHASAAPQIAPAYEAAAAFQALRLAWPRGLQPDNAADLSAPPAALLRLLTEWSARIENAAQAPDVGGTDSTGALQAARHFAARAEVALTAVDVGQDSGQAALATLAPTLDAIAPAMRALASGATQRAAAYAEQRAGIARRHNRIAVGLTVLLSVLLLAFGAIALRQLRQLRERRLVLEELTAKLRVARREAEAASESKSAFLANMSHEIRTPFHGLMGMLSLLRETGLTARQVDHLRTATESADHLLAILNDILDMSQLEAGRMSLAPAPTDLRALLRDVEALMRPQANAKSLALHIDTAPGVPERLVADATRVKQVLFNLLSNAIKFSESGQVMLDVRVCQPALAATSAATTMLEFAVTDTGIGMDDATLRHLFTRFAQADTSASRRHSGTGLGLEISRTLARLMGGDITARSKPSAGSVFSFHMPLVAVALPVGVPAHAHAAAIAGTHASTLQVLVAEDHPVNRQYLAALLENLGHRAHFTANGHEALEAIRAMQARSGQHFDVVLMDLHMPVLDGIAATRAIRALPDGAAATVPIVALTADAFEQTRERCMVAGMNDFLTKPVSPQKLAASLRRLFGAEAVARAPPEELPTWRAGAVAVGLPPLIDTAAIEMALQAMPAARLAQMISDFLAQGPQTVQRLRAAVRDAQPLELRVNAHAAKGAALNLGLSALAATATALQEGAAHLPAHEIARLVQRFEELLPLTRDAVDAAGLAPPSPAN